MVGVWPNGSIAQPARGLTPVQNTAETSYLSSIFLLQQMHPTIYSGSPNSGSIMRIQYLYLLATTAVLQSIGQS